MSEFEIRKAYPLQWPEGRARTRVRKEAKWRDAGRRLTWTTAFTRLREQLNLMTPVGRPRRVFGAELTTNIRFTLAGARDKSVSRLEPTDPGAALYFELDAKPHVLACDRWDTVYDNVAAIAAHIEALRGQERWGVADLAQAFAGHVALPRPDPWWVVLGVASAAAAADVRAAYRQRARTAHPDTGGDRAEWDRLQTAYEQAAAEGRT